MAPRHAALLAALALGACDEPTPRTEIVVVVTTDLRIGEEVDSVAIRVLAPTGGELNREFAVVGSSAIALPASLALALTSGPLEPVVVRATARYAGDDIVTTEVQTAFVREKTKKLVLTLEYACIDVTCAESGETCRTGTCTSNAIDGASLPDWDGNLGKLVVRDAGAEDGSQDGAQNDAQDDAAICVAPDAETDAEGAPACACDGDVDGNGPVNTSDTAKVVDCLDQPISGRCARADVDCDGAITWCDIESTVCMVQTRSNCCGDSVHCGACCLGATCTHGTENDCFEWCGVYKGDDVTCACADGECAELPEPGANDFDFNQNGTVDGPDIGKGTQYLGALASSGVCAVFDVNQDGTVNECDVDIVICAFEGFDPAACSANATCAPCCSPSADCKMRAVDKCRELGGEPPTNGATDCETATCPG